MQTPMEPLVAQLVDQLDANRREDWEERAAIMEFEALLPRAHAECLALLDVLYRHPTVLTKVAVLEVAVDGAITRVLTTDVKSARAQLIQRGAREVRLVDLRTVIDQHYGGIALLTAMS